MCMLALPHWLQSECCLAAYSGISLPGGKQEGFVSTPGAFPLPGIAIFFKVPQQRLEERVVGITGPVNQYFTRYAEFAHNRPRLS